MTIDRRTLLIVLLALGSSSACRDAPLAENIRANNKTPIAHAGEDQTVAYNGSPVAVTLDASQSMDLDGTIVTYRWLSGLDAPDGGIGLGGIDPEDQRSPTVMLEAGTWELVLFVVDDEGGVSQPDTVAIQVGDGLPPAVGLCVADSDETIAQECKVCVCGLDEMCRDLIVECDEVCWAFYGCVEQSCRELTLDPADADALAECASSTCGAFFDGVPDWIPLETCVRRDPCGTICSDSVQVM